MDDVTESAKTLVLCFDGTAEEYDANNTNVPQLFALLKKDDFHQQLCYYQAGIGTWFNPGVVAPMFQWGAKILDEAFAWYLDAHVIDGYRFIMNNWKAGDKICLFGFSRGAYTARALAGALHKVGLLSRGNDAQIPFAYKLYKREDQEGIKLAAGFKETYCQDVKIEFIGVWETVASVGLIMGRNLPFTASNSAVKTFRHALSLDEHRARFQPNLYHNAMKNDDDTTGFQENRSDSDTSDSGIASDFSDNESKGVSPFRLRRSSGKARATSEGKDNNHCDVLEVWFAGCHTDIGGSAVPNGTPQALSDIPLRWMIREIVKSQCGILFDSDALKRAGIDLTPDSAASKEQDDGDALQPIHDSLKQEKVWWILEILPMKFTWQDPSGKWISKFRWNLGRGRDVHSSRPLFHSSVKTRMESNLNYKPRARWTPGSEVYVS